VISIIARRSRFVRRAYHALPAQGERGAPSIHGDVTQEQSDAIDAALRNARLIEAIRLYRIATGAGLKEAKDWAQARAVHLKQSSQVDAEIQGAQSGPAPSPFEAKRGCLAALVLLFFAARR
jgi:ribosomal protein L7/L12